MIENKLYNSRGVSASKSEVHHAIKGMDKGLYPNAFCKILPDIVAGDPDFCNIMHADTAGTKTSLAYLYWKETGDLSVWEGIVQDSIVMNVDDMACVGCMQDIILSSTIGRNKHLIPSEVLSELIQASKAFVDNMKEWGINIHLSGGETADVGDIVRTVDVVFTSFARMAHKDLIINDIQHGDVIVGFSSYGQAKYETVYNGGMGSNGLSSARHDLLDHSYAQEYPESFDPNTDKKYIYCGTKKLTSQIAIPNFGFLDIGKLMLSPTRTYLPLLKNIFDHEFGINGIIHCTGGAQTKVLKFVNKKHIIKNNLLAIPPLFKMIEIESSVSKKEMYEVFNMGHRLEIYTNQNHAKEMIDIAAGLNIQAQIIGYVEDHEVNQVSISDESNDIYTYN